MPEDVHRIGAEDVGRQKPRRPRLAYLFNTDTLSNLIRCAPKSSLVSRLACVPPGEQFTSSVTFGEVIRGALRSGRSGLLLEQIEAVIPAMFALMALSWGSFHPAIPNPGIIPPTPDAQNRARRSSASATRTVRLVIFVGGIPLLGGVLGPPAVCPRPLRRVGAAPEPPPHPPYFLLPKRVSRVFSSMSRLSWRRSSAPTARPRPTAGRSSTASYQRSRFG
jgi:hypothetical protein